jgi:wyosine [tRNA(Phe)-imidazoG37] synthetase (radical SAM superfamily)
MFSTVFLELTNNCNMNCDFCANQLMKRKRGFISVKLAKNVINQLKEMHFNGSLITSLMGEPLLHPEFMRILQYSIDSGITTNVITNFSLVPNNISITELLNAGIDILHLSYQTPNEETFYSRHSRFSYADYREKLFNFLAHIRDNAVQTRVIEIHILHSFYNYLNIEVVDDYSLIESTALELAYLLYPTNTTTKTEALRKQILKSVRSFRRGKQYLDTYKIELSPKIHLVFKRANTWANHLIPEGCIVSPRNKGTCAFFESLLGVFWDGRCTVCCLDFDGEIFIGDARSNTLQEIWYGKRVSYMRALNKKGLLSNNYCQSCKGRICRNNKVFSLIKDHGFANNIWQLLNRIRRNLDLP